LSQRNTLELAGLASPIVGTPLVLVAKNVKSPRQAARVAAYLGYARDAIQATRWAAVIARRERDGEEKPGTFDRFFGPLPDDEFGDLPDLRKKTQIQIEHYCEAEGKWQPLNKAELSATLADFRDLFRGRGVRVTEISSPAADSRWPSSIRWQKDKK